MDHETSNSSFLIKNNKILLAMKKRGFGEGKWNGYGGKPNKGETILETAIRETKEEIDVIPKDLKQVATLNFHFKESPEWDQQAIVFISKKWLGEPSETEEMKPQWFDLSKIPFKSMWSDDPFWLPLVLKNKKVKSKFTFDKNNNILEKELIEIKSF